MSSTRLNARLTVDLHNETGVKRSLVRVYSEHGWPRSIGIVFPEPGTWVMKRIADWISENVPTASWELTVLFYRTKADLLDANPHCWVGVLVPSADER